MTFTYVFYKHIMFRHSCGVCHFTNTKRPSDITIADYWGWEKTDPDFNKDDKGVSLVLVNTEKGKALFEAVKDKMDVIPAKLEDCIQPNLQRPTPLSVFSDMFERDYIKYGFKYVMKFYATKMFLFKRIQRKVTLMLKAIKG